MDRLFYFLFQYRAFLTFFALEVFCAWLVIEHNRYQGSRFFNSSNSVVANLNNFSQGIRNYFLLSDVNSTLAEENAMLRKQLDQQKQKTVLADSLIGLDSAIVNRYEFISAKVVNNQVDRFKNFITISKGEDDGIQPGMAVISSAGAVGKVKIVSDHFSVVTSLLNIDVMTSAMLKRTGHYGSAQWGGTTPEEINLLYIPRHVTPVVGDTVVTSGYNAVYPQGIVIGTITEFNLSDEALFYNIKIRLAQDFRKLAFVTVVKSNLKHEQDSIEQVVLDKTK